MADPSYIDPTTGVLTDPEAWVALDTELLSSDTATITFESTYDGQVGDWSQYMDLVIIASARSDNGSGSWDNMRIALNNDTTDANYNRQYIYGYNTAVTAAIANNRIIAHIPCDAEPSTIFGGNVMNFSDINSGKYKSMLFQNNAETHNGGIVEIYTMTWGSQAAITEIDLTVVNGTNFKANSIFSLFGGLPSMLNTGTVS